MNYKIVRIAPLSQGVVRRNIERELKGYIHEYTYDDLYKSVFSNFYNYADSFSDQMNRMGNESVELLIDCEMLQKKWAHENGVSIDDDEQWQLKIVAAQLERIQPEVIYVQGIAVCDGLFIREIQNRLPNLRLVVQYTGFPDGYDRIDPEGLLLVGSPCMVKQLQDAGYDPRLSYHSFDPRVLDRLEETNRVIDFSFVGCSGFGYRDGHKNRFWDLLKLAHTTNITLWLDEREYSEDTILNEQGMIAHQLVLKDNYLYDLDYDLSQYPAPPFKLRHIVDLDRIRLPVYGIDFFQLLADSALTFHRHTDTVQEYSAAMRLFQATGVGACLIMDEGLNTRDLFEPDSEVVTYKSLAECVEKVRYLQAHEAERKKIAAAGQRRALAQHTVAHRCEEIHQWIVERLAHNPQFSGAA